MMVKSSTERSSDDDDPTPPLGDRDVGALFTTLTSFYGRKFSQSLRLGGNDITAKVMATWSAAIQASGITRAQFERGVKNLLSSGKTWPPDGVEEVLRLCRPRPEDLGLPQKWTAYYEAMKPRKEGRHPVIDVVRELSFEQEPRWLEISEEGSRAVWGRVWDVVIDRVCRGEEVAVTIPPAIGFSPEKAPELSQEERKHLAARFRAWREKNIGKTKGGGDEQS